MAPSERELLNALSRMPFVYAAELASLLGDPLASNHRGLIGLVAGCGVGSVSHGTVHLPSSQR